MYISVKTSWFTTGGRIERHYKDERGKLIIEYIGSTKKKEDADKIVELLNKVDTCGTISQYLSSQTRNSS